MSNTTRSRFAIAQDGGPTEKQLSAQREVRAAIAATADLIEHHAPVSREMSLALTHLEEALMWAGKAIFGS